MSDIQKYLGNAQVVNGRLTAPLENEPRQYSNRGYPYLNTANSRFFQEYAQYSSDYFRDVPAQGLDPDDFYAWQTITMRMAELVKTSAAMQRQFDNHKMVLLDKMKYAYVPRGTKFVVMGSTWLCTNPENISGSDGIGVVQRCNVTWNHLDWYGNVAKEPVVFETEILRANAPDPQYNMNVMKGYFNLKCQYNKDTAQIDDNTRMIFGTSCYVVTGYSDFEQEFTGDYDSVHFVQFSIRKDEIDDTKDDRKNHVAGGKLFSWDISITGNPTVPLAGTVSLSASSLRCGENVTSTSDHPITYLWSSSDESIAVVDENGQVTPVSEGVCTITASLEQNPRFTETFTLEVIDAQSKLAWKTTPPEKLNAFETITLEVVPVNAGDAVEWRFSGADLNAYSYTVEDYTATVTCWSGSIQPLKVAVLDGQSDVTAVIPLNGI